MQIQPEIVPKRVNRQADRLGRVGVIMGLKLAVGLSIAYAILSVFGSMIFTSGFSGIVPTLFVLIVGSPLIILFGVLPAILYGMVTGRIIGVLAARLEAHLSRLSFAIISVVTCASIAALSHILLGITPNFSFRPMDNFSWFGEFDSYPILIGFPTLIYILAGGWAGWKLYKL